MTIQDKTLLFKLNFFDIIESAYIDEGVQN